MNLSKCVDSLNITIYRHTHKHSHSHKGMYWLTLQKNLVIIVLQEQLIIVKMYKVVCKNILIFGEWRKSAMYEWKYL